MFWNLVWISVSTVGKVLLVAATGIVLSKNLSNKRESLKGMSYITVYIMLPCLLFTEMTKVVSWDSLAKYYSAVLLSLVPMMTGFMISKGLRGFVPDELHGLLMLACTFQNALSFGLGVLMSLHGVSWFTADRLSEAEGYVFLYNVCCSLSLWSFAMHIVKTCKAEADALEARRLREAPAAAAAALTDVACRSASPAAVIVPPPEIIPPSTPTTTSLRSSGALRTSQLLQVSAVANNGSCVGAPSEAIDDDDDTPVTPLSPNNLRSSLSAPLEATKELELAKRDDDKNDHGDNQQQQEEEDERKDSADSNTMQSPTSAIEASGLHSSRSIEMTPYGGTVEERRRRNKVSLGDEDDDDDVGCKKLRESGTNVSPTSRQREDVAGSSSAARVNQEQQQQRLDDAGQQDRPTVPAGTTRLRFDKLVPARAQRALTRAGKAYESHVKPLLSTTILASFFGIFVALFPPCRLVAESNIGKIFIGGLSMLGEGTVPMTLLILGCNLMTDEATSPTAVAIPKRFVVVVVAVRLVIVPALFLSLMHVLYVAGIIPENRVFRLTVLVESCAPTAINASVICSFFSYRTREFSRVLFIVYVASIVSTTAWLMIYLWYLGE